MNIKNLICFIALTGLPGAAFAHTGVNDFFSFSAGFIHPFHGLDHMLAMLAIGLWAVRLGNTATWLVPVCFVLFMAFGSGLANQQIDLPHVETTIALSVLILGLLIASTRLLAWPLAALIAACFAIFHGHAHGTEIMASANALSYALGFAAASASLHLIGIAIGTLIAKSQNDSVDRWLGTGIALSGIWLLIA